jgi:hypothetical protein
LSMATPGACFNWRTTRSALMEPPDPASHRERPGINQIELSLLTILSGTP